MSLKFLNLGKKSSGKQAPQDRGELVFKEGTKQFKRLIEKGLRVPVVFL